MTIVATSGASVVSAVTDSQGEYSLNVIQGGTYTITESLPVVAISGVTSLEALDALKLSVGINPNATNNTTGTKAAISPYEYMAADVLGKGSVTALDALDILKMAVGPTSAPVQKWEFVPTTQPFWSQAAGGFTTTAQAAPTATSTTLSLTVGNVPATQDFAAVLTGNVNGSYAPNGSSTATTTTVQADALAAGDPADQFGIASYTVASVLVATLTGEVDVVDSAANVFAKIDNLESLELGTSGLIYSIWLTDNNNPTVNITSLQAYNDQGGVMSTIIGNFTTNISASAGVTALNIHELSGTVNVTMTGNTGTASIASSAISFNGNYAIETFGSGVDTQNFSLGESLGVVDITNFKLGTDVLDITLNGGTLSSMLVTSGSGISAVSGEFIYSTSDQSHGIFLAEVTLPTSGVGGFGAHITSNGGVATIT